MTDTLGRMHSDAQFAGSSSVPAHVEMMGFLVSVTIDGRLYGALCCKRVFGSEQVITEHRLHKTNKGDVF